MYTETHLTPRFSDTDAMGHINNSAVAQWLEAGRIDFYINQLKLSASKVLRRIEVDYDREMNFKDEAVIHTGVERLSNKTITLRQEIYQSGQCCVKALVIQCYFDPQTRTAVPIPTHDRKLYSKRMFNDAP